MKVIQKLMTKHPMVSALVVFPFTLLITLSVFSLIIDILLPVLFSLWMTGWIYRAITRSKRETTFYSPFWFARGQRWSP